MEILALSSTEVITRLVVAMALGFLIGGERVFAGKVAGMRTHALVSMGAALFVIISTIMATNYAGLTVFDPLRMAAHIITGMGFIGAGLIILRDKRVRGLTTAAGLWVSSGIGIAAGFGLYTVAVSATFLALFIFTAMWFIENLIKKMSPHHDGPEEINTSTK